MKTALTEAQMRLIEHAAIESGSVSGLNLIARAGKAVAVEIHRRCLHNECRSVHVLCGPGNNGGDGFAVASHLVSLGWNVRVWSLAGPERLRGDARKMFLDWSSVGSVGRIEEFTDQEPSDGAIVVDALFGMGLSRPLDQSSCRALERALHYPFLVAVDILSGVSPDTGKFISVVPVPLRSANLTVTFQCPKLGHYLGEGGWLSGDISVVSIGLEEQIDNLMKLQSVARVVYGETIGADRFLRKLPTQHKYDHGHVLVLAGGRGRGGAARLAARSALRIGAGLVTVGVHSDAIVENAAQLNAVMLVEISNPDDLARVLTDQRINSICIGPGLGVNASTRALVRAVLSCLRNTVLDADAITSFEKNPDELFRMLHGHAVLTPHLGEFRRLFPELSKQLTQDMGFSMVDAVRQAAKMASATILLKGATTIIASPGSAPELLPATGTKSAPWLATAGSGDVLAGLLTGLMARGLGTVEAARCAAWIHAEAARRFGPGLISEDIPDQIPGILKDLLAD